MLDIDSSASGGSGDDEIVTGNGSDTVDPGTGRDEVRTGAGADSVLATSDLERPRYRDATGTIALPVWVWSAGRLVLFGPELTKVVRSPEEDGQLNLPIELEDRALRTLRRHGRVTVVIGIRFRPEIGIARTLTKRLKLVLPDRSARGQ